MPVVGILDYGVGNLRSVEKGLGKVGVDARLCSDADGLSAFDGLILPGVGAFGDAMDSLKALGMDEAIKAYITTGRHLMGICLGMQLLLGYSEEHGHNDGLGVVPGGCLRLPDTVKVPHMGWNAVDTRGGVALFRGLEGGERFYFVHSYFCAPSDPEWVIGATSYGMEFASAIGKDNVWGLQFHPEKSSTLGLRILENFGRMIGAV